jgi:hypothetical protein
MREDKRRAERRRHAAGWGGASRRWRRRHFSLHVKVLTNTAVRAKALKSTVDLSCIPRAWKVDGASVLHTASTSDAVSPGTPAPPAIAGRSGISPSRRTLSSPESAAGTARTLDLSPDSESPRARTPRAACSACGGPADHAFVFFSAISAPNGPKIRPWSRSCARTARRVGRRGCGASWPYLGGHTQATAREPRCCSASTSTPKYVPSPGVLRVSSARRAPAEHQVSPTRTALKSGKSEKLWKFCASTGFCRDSSFRAARTNCAHHIVVYERLQRPVISSILAD